MHSISRNNLVHVVWPGDTDSVPKGWEIPTNGKKLRIGVPIKRGYTEFVRVIRDPNNNTTYVIGFCIDIFKAALEKLPYEFVLFPKPGGESTSTYNGSPSSNMKERVEISNQTSHDHNSNKKPHDDNSDVLYHLSPPRNSKRGGPPLPDSSLLIALSVLATEENPSSKSRRGSLSSSRSRSQNLSSKPFLIPHFCV
ncbi:glutamate receptor 2.8-like [Senna tora]|uniref:Glutamate receptor 2.8-like n=1 Tax=Senna tora TaxID=362788 RepID=A0A834XG92_9FABA|nr:glutamate receptor 2.8-like [Senna tora]